MELVDGQGPIPCLRVGSWSSVAMRVAVEADGQWAKMAQSQTLICMFSHGAVLQWREVEVNRRRCHC